MTVGDFMKGLSSAEDGANALDVVANIEGTYPVFTPFDSFEISFSQPKLTANLHVEELSANLTSENLIGDVESDLITCNLTSDNLQGDLK